MNVDIKGSGAYTPKSIVGSTYFKQSLETSDEWTSKITGIKGRHWANEGQDISDLAYSANTKTIEDTDIQPVDIDMIIVTTATEDMPFPNVANILREKLGTGKVTTMDQLAACSGFMYSMITVKQYVQPDDYKHILVMGTDKLSKITSMTDRSTAVLFGDGAGAVVMGGVAEGRDIISYEMGSNGSSGKCLYSDGETGRLEMNDREVSKFAARIMSGASTRVVEKAGLSSENMDLFISHQADIRIVESARERLGVEREKMGVSVDKYGNTSAASILLSINQELQSRRIEDDDTLVLVGFGGGLAWGAVVTK